MAIEKNKFRGIIIITGLFGAGIATIAGLLGIINKSRRKSVKNNLVFSGQENDCLDEGESIYKQEVNPTKDTILKRREYTFYIIFSLLIGCILYICLLNNKSYLFPNIGLFMLSMDLALLYIIWLPVALIITLENPAENFKGPFWDGLDRVVGINKDHLSEEK